MKKLKNRNDERVVDYLKMSFELAGLSAFLSRCQEVFRCSSCQQYYQIKWFDKSQTKCFFCKKFNPQQTTYHLLLKEIEWCFIQSGEDDKHKYYNDYLNNLHNWCIYYHIYHQIGDLEYEQELRSV